MFSGRKTKIECFFFNESCVQHCIGEFETNSWRTGAPAPPVCTANWGTTSCFNARWPYELRTISEVRFTRSRFADSRTSHSDRKKNETKETGRFTSAENLTPIPTPLLLTCCEILTKTSIIPPLRLLLSPLGRGTHSRRQKAPGDSTSFQNVVATEAIQVPAETTSEETLLHWRTSLSHLPWISPHPVKRRMTWVWLMGV